MRTLGEELAERHFQKGLQEGLQEGRREGMRQGKAVEAIQLILRMSEQGCALEKIAEWTGKEMDLIRSILEFQRTHPECTAEEIAKALTVNV